MTVLTSARSAQPRKLNGAVQCRESVVGARDHLAPHISDIFRIAVDEEPAVLPAKLAAETERALEAELGAVRAGEPVHERLAPELIVRRASVLNERVIDDMRAHSGGLSHWRALPPRRPYGRLRPRTREPAEAPLRVRSRLRR